MESHYWIKLSSVFSSPRLKIGLPLTSMILKLLRLQAGCFVSIWACRMLPHGYDLVYASLAGMPECHHVLIAPYHRTSVRVPW